MCQIVIDLSSYCSHLWVEKSWYLHSAHDWVFSKSLITFRRGWRRLGKILKSFWAFAKILSLRKGEVKGGDFYNKKSFFATYLIYCIFSVIFVYVCLKKKNWNKSYISTYSCVNCGIHSIWIIVTAGIWNQNGKWNPIIQYSLCLKTNICSELVIKVDEQLPNCY